MELPKFLLGDNTDFPDAVFVIHTDFPRFIINLENDEVEWLEEFDQHDQKELESEAENYIREATEFYDREIARYDDDAWTIAAIWYPAFFVPQQFGERILGWLLANYYRKVYFYPPVCGPSLSRLEKWKLEGNGTGIDLCSFNDCGYRSIGKPF